MISSVICCDKCRNLRQIGGMALKFVALRDFFSVFSVFLRVKKKKAYIVECTPHGTYNMKRFKDVLIFDVDDLVAAVEGDSRAVGEFHIGEPVVLPDFLNGVLRVILLDIRVNGLGNEEGGNVR